MWVDVQSTEYGEDGCVVMRALVPARAIEAEIGECLESIGARGGIGPGAGCEALAARYGEAQLNELIAQWVMERHSYPAIESLKAPIACDPEYTALSRYVPGGDLSFQVKAYLLPKGELASAGPVTVAPSAVGITDAEVDERVRELAERDARRVEVDLARPVKMGDIVQVDTRIAHEGMPIPAYSRDGALLRMETGAMPPAFIEAVEGMLPGEIREFSFEAPGPLGGTAVSYDAQVHVGKVSELRLPELDDEWARSAWPGATGMASLRRLVAEALGRRNGSATLDDAVDEALAERLDVELPDALVEFAAGRMEADLRERLAGNGLTVAQHCAARGQDEADLRAGLREQALKSLRQAIALDALFERRRMTLSESDLNDAASAMTHADAADAKRNLILAGKMHLVEEAARRSKAHQWLVETAEVA